MPCPVPALRALLAFVAVVLLAGCGQTPTQSDDGASLPRVRLMSDAQYANAIAQVFGDDVSASVIPPLPPLTRTDGLLSSGAAFAGVTSDQVSQIQQAAAAVAARVVDEDHRQYLIPCTPESATGPDPACASQFLRESGELLFRRPLDDAQLAELVDIAGRAAERTGDFHEGLALALEAMLISPDFIFIADRSEPDPDRPGEQRLDSWSIASRLSFFLWNAPPDRELLQAAASGALQTPEGRARAVDRLLASPRLEIGMRAFFDDMLAFDDFDSLAKDPHVYPMVTAATLRDAREQTLRTIIDHLLTRNADYRDLYTTRRTFMSMPLAAIYGTPASQGWQPYEFDADSPRIGLLTQVSFLAAHSHAVRSSPTKRGKALRELLLCQKVPDPPPNVNFSALEDAGNVATARERIRIHTTNASCAGCHLITDPMGLSLENFDGGGQYRETEHGAQLDITGELDGVAYDDLPGLASAVRNHPKLPACLVDRLYAWGTGGPVTLRDDRDLLARFTDAFAADGYRLPALLRELALSRAFVTVRSGERPDDAPARMASAPELRIARGLGEVPAANLEVEAHR